VLVLRTLSKSFSLAGMRVGLGFGQAPLIAELCKVKDSYNLSRVSIAAGTAALEDYDAMRAHVARVAATRARLIAALRRLGYDVPDSQTNFVLARKAGVDQRPVWRPSSSAGSWCAISRRRSCAMRCGSRWGRTRRSMRW
jgi:histidinol-phosphate aminotransferase